ncbi:MAG: hypothetical protein L3J16_01165 [Anaerolineales bacterium]|nr:hypothetical protein [Anaerolineales bacterium]
MRKMEKRIEGSGDQINMVEDYLAHTLKAVRPPGDVMQRLQERIGSLEPHLIVKRLSNWELVLIVTGSVMSAAVVILTVARALFYFFGRRGGRMM